MTSAIVSLCMWLVHSIPIEFTLPTPLGNDCSGLRRHYSNVNTFGSLRSLIVHAYDCIPEGREHLLQMLMGACLQVHSPMARDVGAHRKRDDVKKRNGNRKDEGLNMIHNLILKI